MKRALMSGDRRKASWVVSLPPTPEAQPLLREALQHQVLAARQARDDGPTGTDLAESEARLFVAGERFFSHGRPFDASHLLEYALCYAVFHAQRDAVQFLLSKNPDLNVKEPAHGSTALGMAKYPHHRAEGRAGGSPDIAAILEGRMRP